MNQIAALRGIALFASLTTFAACGSSNPSVSPTAPTTGDTTPQQTVQFTGLVSDVSGSCPSITFTAGAHTVATVRGTTFQAATCSNIKRGALVEIDGATGDKAIVYANRIALAADGPGIVGLLTDVAGGGYVLFFRHSERDAGALPSSALALLDNRGECAPGSELTATGRTDAVALGQRFQRYGIEVDKVYASPTCRTTEMARLAFGSFETTRALTWAGMWAPGEEQELAPVLRGLLATVPAPGKINVLIAHNDVMRSSRVGFDITLDQAEAAVFRPHGGDSFELLGKIPKSEWMGKQ